MPDFKNQSKRLKAQADGSLSEVKTYNGQDHLVVPVIAMVEGVRFGANQTEAELGLAQDFGKYPTAWDNRPLVVDHPQIDGNFVSANSVEVLEDFAFGFTNQAKVEDGKLKLNAWINLARADDLEVVQDFVDMIENDEMIEVSVGFHADVIQKKGSFKGQSYSGVWKNIVPDHLALLTSELGACSIEDGCGIPRLNSKDSTKEKETNMSFKTDSANTGACPCGGSDPSTCTCSDNKDAETTPTTVVSALKGDSPKESDITVMAVAGGITDRSVCTLIENALRDFVRDMDICDAWLVSYTVGDDSTAIFTHWCNGMYATQGIRFDLDEDGEVTFIGEPFNVRVVARVIAETDDSQENNMSTQKKGQENKSPEVVEETTTTTKVYSKDAKNDQTVVINGDKDNASSSANVVQEAVKSDDAPKVLSQKDAISQMSEADQALVNQGLAMVQAKRDGHIKTLMENENNKFTQEQLEGMETDMLSNLVELSGSVTVQAEADDEVENYGGRAAPAEPTVNVGNAEDNPNAVMAAPTVFKKKTEAA